MSNKVLVLWAFIIVMLCATILVIGYNQKDKVLMKLENDIKKASEEYILDNDIVPKYNESATIDIDDLIDNEYLKETVALEKYCVKKVIFTKGAIFNDYEIIKECNQELKNAE